MRSRYASYVVPLVCGGAAFLIYSLTAARTITTRYGGVDGAELAAVALSGGVPHPSGYPAYMLLARLLLLLPIGEPAGRLALLSAVSAALAAAATALLVARSADRPTPLAGLAAGLLIALSPRMWSQAIIVEVYALALLWLALCTQLILWWLHSGRRRAALSAALMLGLGLGVHLTLAALLPAAALAWLVAPRRPQLSRRLLLAIVLALLAGLFVYALLPIWARRLASPSWGDATTFAGFWAHVRGAEYAYLVGITPWNQRLARLSFVARDLLSQPGLYGLTLALGWGWAYGWRTQRPLVVLSGVTALLSLTFALSYGGADGTVYLLPWTWSWCVWAGLAIQAMSAAERRTMQRGVTALLILGLALTVGWQLSRYQQLNLRADRSERERVQKALSSLPSGAIVLTSADADTFGSWYMQQAFDLRPDVLVIDLRLAAQPWYQRQTLIRLAQPRDREFCTALRTTARPLYQWSAPTQLITASTASLCS
jgi:4-amino-4-deoxy-L-arabinose transferase-like glycosyltransferase